MAQLIIAVISIGLMAALTLATINYTPAWVKVAQEVKIQAETGFQALENAYLLYAQYNNGAAPAVDVGRQDGGLKPALQSYFSFLPRPPVGYAWTYGYTPQHQLEADGYTGNPEGGLNWLCLYSLAPDSKEEHWRAFGRVQRVLPTTQFYVSTGGATHCGRPLNSAPAAFPASISATMFVRYIQPAPPPAPPEEVEE